MGVRISDTMIVPGSEHLLDEPGSGLQPGDALAELSAHVHRWHQVDDTSHVTFALSVAVSSALDDAEPLWGMVVGAPSSGKTETVRMLDDAVDSRVDELTGPAALLSWSRHKQPRPVGVLARVGSRALVSVADFSTVLASSDRGARDQLFSLLRRAYDGSVFRDVGNAPEPLRWEGRLTLLAAVTPAIDDYAAHADALGPRWLYWRMPAAGTRERRRGAARSSADLAAMRQAARELATEAVHLGRDRLAAVDLDAAARAALADAAVVVCAARGAVPRDGYGKRLVIGVPVVEEPYRLVDQLRTLTRSAVALGLDQPAALTLARRAALATVPAARRAVLDVLADGEPLTVRQVATRGHLHPNVARMALEELRELRLTCCPVEDDAGDPDRLATTARDWQLAEELGDLAAAVLHKVRPSVHERGDSPPIPPGIGGLRSKQRQGNPTSRVQSPRRSAPHSNRQSAVAAA